ncbi:phage/plasmid primase, P4 family [Pseudobacillus badius]|uniref:phage/plasmid primase, P4 family n=1 Tax=Bacillus badius TaxID=1455 RepID=UPI0007B3EEB8|nr:phage/plasmid primase, P4 family [Bacillus badius]KZR57496.1 hypothetical protein A3781_19905 [Bacillus badius]
MSLTRDTKIIRPQFENIPAELREREQWVLWKSLKKNGKLTKTPFSVVNKMAKVSDPLTWATFDEVKAAYERGGFEGIGFVFTKEDGFIGVDLDDHAKDGQPITAAAQVLSSYSYAEISPSGTGIHVIFKGELPASSSNKNTELKMEIYESGRFFTFTGHKIGLDKITGSQPLLDNIVSRYFPIKRKKPAHSTNSAGGRSVDEKDLSEIKRVMFSSRNGEKIKALWSGDISAHNNDHSSADQALCNHLAFYTGKDFQSMDTLFRESGLFRPKWDRKHGHCTYGEMTIERAILDTRTVYSFSISNKQKQDNEKAKEADSPADSPYFEGKTFIPKYLADEIMSEYRFIYDGSAVYLYKDGVYRVDKKDFLGSLAQKKLGKDSRINRVHEVCEYVKRERRIAPDDWETNEQIINVKNGLYDRKTGELKPHTPDYLTRTQLPVKYDPEAVCPEIAEFLINIVPTDTLNMIFEWFGYCLIPSTRYEKALMLTGSGSNGKSKFIELFERFIGTENISNVPLQDLENNRFKLAQLHGKLANTFADIPAERLEKSSIFKTVVSGDRTSAEFKGKDSFDFKPFARLVFSANEMPKSADLTYGFFRRWLIVPFPNKFGEGGLKRDPYIMQKISTEEELSGLLNMALKGLQRLEECGGFSENETTKQALEQYEREADTLLSFIEEECVIDEKASVSKNDLFYIYGDWCRESNYKPLGRNKFYKRIKERVHIVEKRKNPREGWRFYGIGIDRP